MLQYLLGELSEEEQTLLEKKYFSDPEAFHELRGLQYDLIDAYVHGNLSPQERLRFESYFMASPRRKDLVVQAKAFSEKIMADLPAEREDSVGVIATRSWWDNLTSLFSINPHRLIWNLAGVLIAVGVFVGIWFLINRNRSVETVEVNSPEVIPAQQQSVEPTPTTAPATVSQNQNDFASGPVKDDRGLPRKQQQAEKPLIATFILRPDLLRGEEQTTKLILQRKISQVVIKLPLEGEGYEQYRAVIKTPEGEQIWSGVGAAAVMQGDSGRVVKLIIPGRTFANSDYVLDLQGATAADHKTISLGKYYFRVEKR